MIYTPKQLQETILPMIESVMTKKDAEACAAAIVEIIKQDREAHAKTR